MIYIGCLCRGISGLKFFPQGSKSFQRLPCAVVLRLRPRLRLPGKTPRQSDK